MVGVPVKAAHLAVLLSQAAAVPAGAAADVGILVPAGVLKRLIEERAGLLSACQALMAAPFSINAHDSGGGVTHRAMPEDDGARTGCRECLAEEAGTSAIATAEAP